MTVLDLEVLKMLFVLFQTLKITKHSDADHLSDLLILQG